MVSGPVVILIGPPGSGKSTVGRLVAEELGASFRDFDDDLQDECGLPAGELVVKLGREKFGEVECRLIGDVLADHSGVLALGGGTPLNPAIQDQLKPFHVVFLDVDLDELLRREGLVPLHPWLLPNPRAHLRQLLGQRRPVYEAVSNVVIPTTGRSAAEVAAEVLQTLHN
ncbi:MAG TPA: shikimate kinase [Pseudonocardiaceae bacterium]|nr:shikimate kinase [Pseudonocardiaceae bacterium]